MATVETLVVAWGWGWGWANAWWWGAGWLIYNASFTVTPQAYSITVGTGWSAGTATSSTNGTVWWNGTNSIFDTLIAVGWGWGSTYDSDTLINPWNGGSGWGWRINDAANGWQTGWTWTSGQWNAWGTGQTGSPFVGAGWWGAGWVGADGNIWTGWVGLQYSISGSATYYAWWGWGWWNSGAGAWWNGGWGAGKNWSTGWSAWTNWLGWGGWGGWSTGAAGSPGFAWWSWVVIISYNTDGSNWVSTSSTGGTITTSGWKTIHTFTSNGTFTMVASSTTNSSFLAFM